MSLIDKAKELFSTVVKEKFADFKLADGTIARAEAIEKDKVLELISEDGIVAVAKEGEYDLEDGTKVKVGADGIITEVMAPAADATEKEMGDIPVDAPAADVKEDSGLEKRVVELEDVVMQLLEKVAKMESEKEAISQEMSEIKKDNEALVKTVPATVKNNFAKLGEAKTASTDKPAGKYADLISQGKVK